MRYLNTMTDEWMTKEEVLADINASIGEVQRICDQLVAFQEKVRENKAELGDQYLSFSSVMENGYDRTGPNEIVVRED
jgi:hypothetical protein